MLPFLLNFWLSLQQELLFPPFGRSSLIWHVDSPEYICLFASDSVSAKSIFQQRSCQEIIIFSLVTKILHKVHTEVKPMTVKTDNGYLLLQ